MVWSVCRVWSICRVWNTQPFKEICSECFEGLKGLECLKGLTPPPSKQICSDFFVGFDIASTQRKGHSLFANLLLGKLSFFKCLEGLMHLAG